MDIAEWSLGREVWSQSETGFSLVSRDGRAPGAWSTDQLAALLGAHRSSDTCTKSGGCSGAFPSAFEYCPSCGGKLRQPHAGELQLWWPPHGNSISRSPRPSGLRLTDSQLLIEQSDPQSRSHTALPRPPGAALQFLVAHLGEQTATLIAMDIANGNLYALAGTKGWTLIEPSAGAQLSECSLPPGAWRVVADDLIKSNRLWMPTDHGLCELKLDLAALVYEAEYLTSPCIGAPVSFAGYLVVPSASQARSMEVSFRSVGSASAEWKSITVELDDPGGWRFESAIVSGRRAVWESLKGQLIVSILPSGKIAAEFIAWPPDCQPWFPLGSPYADKQGQLWRQCRGADGRIRYVRLGRSCEIFDADGPRFSSGGLSFRQGVVILERDNPWEDVNAEADTAAKVIVPLVEHDSEDLAVCAEVDWSGGVGAMLSAPGKVQGRFALRGSVNRDILNFDMYRPWEAVIFVWNRHLFLSHPSFDGIPGWRLA